MVYDSVFLLTRNSSNKFFKQKDSRESAAKKVTEESKDLMDFQAWQDRQACPV